jgi:hypothetical protein
MIVLLDATSTSAVGISMPIFIILSSVEYRENIFSDIADVAGGDPNGPPSFAMSVCASEWVDMAEL